MSAFIVDPTTIQKIANWAVGQGSWLEMTDRDKTAKILIDANIKSIRTRYPDTNGKEIERFTGMEEDTYRIKARMSRMWSGITPVEILKALDCLEYQSCEYASYYRGKAYKMLSRMRRRAITMLPGYEEAPWD